VAPPGNPAGTEKTNIDLTMRIGEIPEGLSGSERLACKKRNVENLGDLMGSWRNVGDADIKVQKGKPGNKTKPKPKRDSSGKFCRPKKEAS
jgi:hypothetical protein